MSTDGDRMNEVTRAGVQWANGSIADAEAIAKIRAVLGDPSDAGEFDQLMSERDALVDLVDDVKAALDIRSEWTNLYGYREFFDEVQSVVALRMRSAQSPSVDVRSLDGDAARKLLTAVYEAADCGLNGSVPPEEGLADVLALLEGCRHG